MTEKKKAVKTKTKKPQSEDDDGGPMIDTCSKNKNYQGVRRPSCNNGYGCLVCWRLYNARRYAKMPEFERHWKELKEETPDWFPELVKDPSDDPDLKHDDGSPWNWNEHLLSELCWNFFIRGLELKLGPVKAPKGKSDDN